TGQNNLKTFKPDFYRFVGADGTLLTGDTIDVSDVVANAMKLKKYGWVPKWIKPYETFSVVATDGQYWIVKLETKWSGLTKYEIFSDGNGDGIWTEIATGHAAGGNSSAEQIVNGVKDTLSNSWSNPAYVDLVGVLGPTVAQNANALGWS
ncbi:MAG: hypothetical protein ACK4TK_08790, partial [Thiobacillaceae bacterium]